MGERQLAGWQLAGQPRVVDARRGRQREQLRARARPALAAGRQREQLRARRGQPLGRACLKACSARPPGLAQVETVGARGK